MDLKLENAFNFIKNVISDFSVSNAIERMMDLSTRSGRIVATTSPSSVHRITNRVWNGVDAVTLHHSKDHFRERQNKIIDHCSAWVTPINYVSINDVRWI